MASVTISQKDAINNYCVYTPCPVVLESSDPKNLMDKKKVQEILRAVANDSFSSERANNASEKAKSALKVAEEAHAQLNTITEKTSITAQCKMKN